MPQMGVSVSEGTIVAWRKQPGDWVAYEEPIVDISTDKIDTEVPSPAGGRVSEIVVEVGTTVDVGTVLARIATDARPGEPHASESGGNGNGATPTSEAAAATGETPAPPTGTPAPPPAGPHPAVPRARRRHPGRRAAAPLQPRRVAHGGRARHRPVADRGHRPRRARAQAGRARLPRARRRRKN